MSARWPHFTFDHVDARNDHYAPDLQGDPVEVRFPGTYDLVFSNSLLTHLMPDAFVQYVTEMVRVTEPGGRMMSTLFVLDEHSAPSVDRGDCRWTLPARFGPAWAEKADDPEAIIAYDVDWITDLLDGLPVDWEIVPGRWSHGQPDPHHHFGNKDFLVTTKR